MNYHNSYQRQAIINASPALLIGKLFDFAIISTHKKEMARLDRILAELIRSLDTSNETSVAMFQLFHYCREINLQKRHDEVLELLEQIRDTWYEVMVKSGTSRQADPAPMKMAGGI